MKKAAFVIAALLFFPVWTWAGKDFGSITGTVEDSAKRPLTRALVSLATSGSDSFSRMVFTDAKGVFTFENLVPGEYTVQVTMPRYASTQKEKIPLINGVRSEVKVSFVLLTVAEVLQRAASRDAKQSQDIIWTLRSSRGTQSVLRFVDSESQPLFGRLSPDYSGYVQFYSKTDPRASTSSVSRGSRFSVTMGLPADAKITVTGQYNESPLEPKGASALYEFSPSEGHQTHLGFNVRQGIVLDDAFSAEELKEVQASYSDRFYLTETLAVEQGAEFGHAEGQSTSNYIRPRGSISWVPNDRIVLTAGFSTQAPTSGDDPVRGREYFEQVNLPPSFEHYLHTEVGASRFLDEATKVSLTVFRDLADYRALFITAPDGRHGLLVFDGKNEPSQGFRLHLNREFNGFEMGLGYTLATGPSLPTSGLDPADIRAQIDHRQFSVVTARVKTDVDLTNTELTAVYRWMSKYAAGPVDPYQQAVEYNDPSLSISIAQNLPTFGAIPAKVQAIFDARNLFEQPISVSGNQLAPSPRFVKGGINIRF